MQSRILIVDDNPKNIQVLANHLTNDDYEVEYASNGKDAVHMIEKEDFDLILLDVMMPGIDGFETCRRIKKIENKKHIPVIFVTAKTDLDSLTLGFEYGGVDYVSKPFKADELLLRVSTHIELKKTRDKLNYQNTFLEKKDVYYNEKLNTHHREFLQKTKELENIIKMQSEMFSIFSQLVSDASNSAVTPLNLLKLELKDEKSLKLVDEAMLVCGENSSFNKLVSEFGNYIIKRQSALKKEKINIAKAFGDCLGSLTKQIKNKKVDIIHEFDQSNDIVADANVINFIINSILENAIDFSTNAGKILVKLSNDNGVLTMVVSDYGPGFEKDIILYPFTPVKRNSKTVYSLFMCKFLCDIHEFSLKIGNTPNQGAFVKIGFNQ
jgi:two-component system, sensor histidine kinase and response regulator